MAKVSVSGGWIDGQDECQWMNILCLGCSRGWVDGQSECHSWMDRVPVVGGWMIRVSIVSR